MAADRFSEMNSVLDSCVAEVKSKVAEYVAKQRRIDKDPSKATFSHLSDAQVSAMAREALNARDASLRDAAVASIVGQIGAESRK